MVAGLKGANYLEKCAELGLETLEKRREDQDLALVYKFVTKKGGVRHVTGMVRIT